jgi:hypothetical protein
VQEGLRQEEGQGQKEVRQEEDEEAMTGAVAPARLAGAICCLGLLVITGWAAQRAHAAFPGQNGKIVFGSERGTLDDDEIFVMDPDGSNPVNLTNVADDTDSIPALSPDGTKIAFVSNRDGNNEIYLMNADGSGQTRLTNNSADDSQPAFSPDGTKIAFSSDRSGISSEILVMNADGSAQTPLTSNTSPEGQAAFSPDGAKIFFGSSRDGNNEIYVMNADGSSQTRLTNNAASDQDLNVSADGQRIAFASSRDGNFEIYSMNADGSSQTRLTNNTAFDNAPAWSPDGQKIAFSTTRDANLEVYAMSANGANQVNLTNDDGADRDPDWGANRSDSDGDGLLDSWENEGIDFTNDGSVELDLPAMGADPLHKDIYVEIDHMSGHALSQTAIDGVVASFGVAPVGNPDGSRGITLHVDNGPSSNMDPRSAGSQWGDLSDQDTLTHQDVLGTGLGDDYNWNAFDLIKAGNFSIHREPVFHYVVSGHRFGSASNSRTGISRGVDDGGSDLLVTLGSLSEPAEGSGTVDAQAGTLMHELGHNLGLHHGGPDDDLYKANYLSVMNYSFQFGLRRTDGGRLLDYSRFQIPLSESALNETSGFGLSASSAPAAFLTLTICPGDPAPPFQPSKMELTPLTGAVDWNCNTLADGTVAADINDDGSLTGLGTSTIDWLALIYAGGGIGSLGVEGLPETTEMIEPQLEELLLNEQALNGELRPLPMAKPPTTVAPATPPAAQPTFTAVKKCKKGQKLKKVKGKKKCVKKK